MRLTRVERERSALPRGSHPVWIAFAVAAIVLGGCAARPARPAVLPVADPATQAERVARLALEAEIVYLGEQHGNPDHHERQRATLAALVAAGARPAIAFEMLSEDMQAEVDELMRAGAGQAEVGRALTWQERGWPDFAWYWPLFDLARRHRLPVVAADLEPSATRTIARRGLTSLGGRAEALRSALPPDPAREEAIARTMQAAHCGVLPPARIPLIVESWHARNVTMARRIANGLERGSPVVVIIGRGHQAPGGLPAQLEALRPGTRQLVVDLLEAPVGGAAADRAPASSAARLIWLTPPVSRPDPCDARQSPPPIPR
jgi:uncharacterized iron-regulated protein